MTELHVVDQVPRPPTPVRVRVARWPSVAVAASALVLCAADPRLAALAVVLAVLGVAVTRHHQRAAYLAGAGSAVVDTDPGPGEPYGDSAPASVDLIAVDAELAGRRLKPLTPGQRDVVARWAARHIAPYEPFPDGDEL